jgi:two-component system, chemotaxis family, chemotaxis protein CheY
VNTTVLVVEDDKDNREMLGEMLALSGYRPVLAADGLEAMRLLGLERPCVILLDLMMPRMDGCAFRKAQLEVEALRAIPVVVVSADANAERKARDIKAAACLAKPLDPDDVLELVRQYSEGPRT